jgi:imidazolonepropionase-like amidohydrolase
LIPLGTKFAIAALAVAVQAGCGPAPEAVDLVIRDVTVYSGSDPEPFVATVAVSEGAIVAVDREGQQEFGAAETIDGNGRFLVPGLWDVHVHLRSSEDRGLDVDDFLRHGVTAVRDLGAYPGRMLALTSALEQSGEPAPLIFPSLMTLNGEVFGPHQRAVTTEQEVRDAIDELAAAGATQIKIHRALSPAMLPVVLKAAHERRLKVVGHIPLGVHPLTACEQGMDGVEHIGSLIEAFVSVADEEQANIKSAIAYLLSDDAGPLFDCLVRRDVAVTPTLVVYLSIARSRAGGDDFPPEFVEILDANLEIVRLMHSWGVTLLTGTDTTDYHENIRLIPGEALLDELSMLQEAGIPPADIIQIATANPAGFLGLDQKVGTIHVGRNAEFVLLRADPGADIDNMREIVAVFRRGAVVTDL